MLEVAVVDRFAGERASGLASYSRISVEQLDEDNLAASLRTQKS